MYFTWNLYWLLQMHLQRHHCSNKHFELFACDGWEVSCFYVAISNALILMVVSNSHLTRYTLHILIYERAYCLHAMREWKQRCHMTTKICMTLAADTSSHYFKALSKFTVHLHLIFLSTRNSHNSHFLAIILVIIRLCSMLFEKFRSFI